MPVRRCLQILEELKTKDSKDITILVVGSVGHDLSIRSGPQPEPYWTGAETWLREKKIIPKRSSR